MRRISGVDQWNHLVERRGLVKMLGERSGGTSHADVASISNYGTVILKHGSRGESKTHVLQVVAELQQFAHTVGERNTYATQRS